MSAILETCKVQFSPTDNQRLAKLCGQFNEHLLFIEETLQVEIHHRGNLFHIIGTDSAIKLAKSLLEKLYSTTSTLKSLDRGQIQMHLQQLTNHDSLEPQNYQQIRTKQMLITTRGKHQRQYIEHLRQFDMNFGIGPAGTGKTFLAVAAAVEALEQDRVRRIILVRPAVEAGERLGFLPGDMSQKVDPYLRPVYDASHEMLGVEKVIKYIEQNIIEIAPLAFMRGRTLNDSFIILDEGQNATKEQMKMFLTRIGFGSIAVITGDVTQIDLPRGVESGLIHAEKILKEVPGISMTYFTARDVVRHPLVQKVIDAYQQAERDKRG